MGVERVSREQSIGATDPGVDIRRRYATDHGDILQVSPYRVTLIRPLKTPNLVGGEVTRL